MVREITLVPAGDRDIPFITDLLKENGLVFSDIGDKKDSLFLARSEGTSVGIGGVEIYGEYGLLRSLAVVREERKKGYGSAVTRGLIHHAQNGGVNELYLLTMTAADFFAGLGFEKVARDRAPRPITETSEFSALCPDSAVLMVRRLG